MKNAAPKAIAIQKAIHDVMRHDRGRLLSALIRQFGDFQTAEDALQEALISALKHWSRSGVPHSPEGWLLKVARNKGIDQMRKRTREAAKAQSAAMVFPDASETHDAETIPDERLRLIFTCCHPALEEKSRVALTLRTVCNLTTREISHAFLDQEATMGQRLSRSKAQIKSKGIAFEVPEPDRWNDRLETVLSTIYLIYTTGYVTEDASDRDLCLEAIHLAELLCTLCAGEAETEGLLSLMLFIEARKHARVSKAGVMVPIEQQDETLWNREKIETSRTILQRAMARERPGPYQIKAAIADCHMIRPNPDWPQMSFLYQSLWSFEPTPVVALNWAVVLSECGFLDVASEKLDQLAPELSDFQPWVAAKAHLSMKLGRVSEALAYYQKAIDAAPNSASKKFLEAQAACLGQ